MADLVAGIGQLVDEEEPPEAVLASPSGEADERHRGEERESNLGRDVVGTAVVGVAGGAGEEEVGRHGDAEGQQEEHRPRQPGAPQARLVHAEPPQERPQALQIHSSVSVDSSPRQ